MISRKNILLFITMFIALNITSMTHADVTEATCEANSGIWIKSSTGARCQNKKPDFHVCGDTTSECKSNTTGSGNTANGYQALSLVAKGTGEDETPDSDGVDTTSNTTGSGNTANGYQALSLVSKDTGDDETPDSDGVETKACDDCPLAKASLGPSKTIGAIPIPTSNGLNNTDDNQVEAEEKSKEKRD